MTEEDRVDNIQINFKRNEIRGQYGGIVIVSPSLTRAYVLKREEASYIHCHKYEVEGRPDLHRIPSVKPAGG